jgi:Kae1-associated kinase Bud32
VVELTRPLYVGAEAEIWREEFQGRAVIAKRRLPKSYRHPELDQKIRRERTRLEASLLHEARLHGVAVPSVVDVDLAAATLRMRFIEGPRLRDVIDQDPRAGLGWSRRFGQALGQLHKAQIVHGDPTTSNAHLDGDRIVLLDFGLAGRSGEVEDRGVDLHLVERTFESSHSGKVGLFEAFLEGYRSALPEARLVERRMAEIKSRARYV